jgi:ATP-dependent DNA ligase
VSKRKGSPYRSGRSPDWLKMKNPEAPAVKREAEETFAFISAASHQRGDRRCLSALLVHLIADCLGGCRKVRLQDFE